MKRTQTYHSWNEQGLVEQEAPVDFSDWIRSKDYRFIGPEEFGDTYSADSLLSWLKQDGCVGLPQNQRFEFYLKTQQPEFSPEFEANLDQIDLNLGSFVSPWADPSNTLVRDENLKELKYGRGQVSDLYQNFRKINIEQPRTALRFVKTYGILGFTDPRWASGIEPWAYFRKEWREFDELFRIYHLLKTKALEDLRNFFIQATQEKFKALDDLTTLMNRKSEQGPREREAAKTAYVSLRWEFGDINRVAIGIWKKLSNDQVYWQARLAFSKRLSDRLNLIRPTLSSSHDEPPEHIIKESASLLLDPRFIGGYFCPRLIDSIFLQFYLDITDPKGILKTCKYCNKAFVAGSYADQGKKRSRNDQLHCSKSCRDAYSQARQRQKRKRAKKGSS